MVQLNRQAKRRALRCHRKFNLTTRFLCAIWAEQKGACALTNLPFVIPQERNGFKASPYSPSIDRIDPFEGYTKSNVRLVVYAVNCSLHNYGEEIFKVIAQAYVQGIVPVETQSLLAEDIIDIGLSTKQSSDRRYRSGHFGTITALFHQSRKHAKAKQMEFSLTKNFVKELLIEQTACALTNLPFDTRVGIYKTSNPFRPSLDRIDSSKGYIPSNVRLVCCAVNYGLNEFGDDVFKLVCGAYLDKLDTQ